MKNNKNYFHLPMALIITAFFLLFSSHLKAQTATNDDVAFGIREYMKVEPDMEAEYIKTESLWKKVHQRRVEEGKIISWSLLKKQRQKAIQGMTILP